MEHVLEVQNLSVAYGDREVVRNCSFALDRGEILGIAGESGSGKTTMAMSIPGLIGENACVIGGKILFCGEDITPPLAEKRACRLRGGEIGVVMQEAMSCLDPNMRIGRLLTESIRRHLGVRRDEAKERAEELLDMAGVRNPKECMKKYPFECSGGMQQRICIAMALSGNPRLLVADEPTTALDVTVQAQIVNLLKRIARDFSIPILMISHDLGAVASACSRLMIMYDGKIVEEGDIKSVLQNGKHAYTRELVRARAEIGHKAGTAPVGKTDGVWYLRARSVWKYFGGSAVLRDVTATLRAGEIYGLAGESGSGKTTFAKVLKGLYQPDRGTVDTEGNAFPECEKAGGSSGRRQQQIQMIFQNPYQSLNPSMTIRENLQETFYAAGVRQKDQNRMADRLSRLMKYVGLDEEYMDAFPSQLSGGQLQRAVIARALLLDPALLICDEPFSALDARLQLRLAEILEKLRQEGLSILFIGHDLPVLQRISDRIGVMYSGLIVEEGAAQQVSGDPWHPYTKELFCAADNLSLKKKGTEKSIVVEEFREQKECCPFYHNCMYAVKKCGSQIPEMYEYGTRHIRCFLYQPDEAPGANRRRPVTARI